MIQGSNLAEKLKDGFAKIKLNKAKVKIPKIKIRPKRQKISVKKPSPQIPVSVLIDILIKNSIEKAKMEAREKSAIPTGKSYSVIKDGKDENIGGYGASSKHYSRPIHSSYVDYGKIFGYLGALKARNAYSGTESLSNSNNSDAAGFQLISSETIEKGARFVRYAKHPTIDLNTSSLVPISGMDSSEWEKFKLWKQLDPVMYLFKTTTS